MRRRNQQRRRTLEERSGQAGVIAAKATVIVKGPRRLPKRGTVPVLVVHDGSKGLEREMILSEQQLYAGQGAWSTYHQEQDLQNHGCGTAQAASQRSLERVAKVELSSEVISHRTCLHKANGHDARQHHRPH
jgi:hypothetical protein